MKDLVIFESNINDGVFSLDKSYYPYEYKIDNIKKDYKTRLDLLGIKYGFDSDKLVVPIQNNSSSEKKLIIDDELYNQKLWDRYFYCDMVVLDSKYKFLPVAVPIADCPLLVCYLKDLSLAVIGHCGVREINKYFPIKLVNALKEQKNIKSEDLEVYISSCIDGNSYVYDKYPPFALIYDVWDNSITKKDDKYYIDVKKAILKQLNSIGISNNNITINQQDTYTDPLLYSNSAFYHGNTRKRGRFLAGAFYK